MKQAVNLRLENSTILTLNRLSEKLSLTKTAIIEKALSDFFKKEQTNPLSKYAGSIPELKSMPKDIKDTKISLL